MRDIFTDYVNAWLLWGKNHERHARMAEALPKDSTEHEKARPVPRRTEALDRPPPPRNASETAAGEFKRRVKTIPRRRLSQRWAGVEALRFFGIAATVETISPSSRSASDTEIA